MPIPPRTSLPDLIVTTPIIALEADGDFGPADGQNYPATTRLSNEHPVVINGTCFHVELFEVDENGDAVNPALVENVDAIKRLCGASPAEMTIKGKKYVAVMFPHEG